MTTETLHPLAAEYLQRMRRAGRRLPPARLRELLGEIEAHLAEAIEPGASDTQVHAALAKLGEPEAIIAAESPLPEVPSTLRGTKEWTAIILLLLGGFALGAGWFAGLILLWTSPAWTKRDKWIGTFVIPGGLATSVILGLLATAEPTKKRCRGVYGGVQHCSTVAGQHTHSHPLGILVAVLLCLAPVVTSVYLARRAR
jgi:hypothetical protein